MPSFSRTELKQDSALLISGTVSDANLILLSNIAVKEVISEHDLKSTKRRSALTPNLFDEIYQYTCPSDLKGLGIIDVKPQIDRGRGDSWRLTSAEEFDRLKTDLRVDQFGDEITMNKNSQWLGENLVAIDHRDFITKLLLSRPVNDDEVSIDGLNVVGDWAGFGDGTNLTADTDNYVKGSGSVNWDINADGGTTAGIYNDSLTDFDVSEYKTTGSVFVWAYITSATNLTNFILRIGSSSSAYYYITITTDNEGGSFVAGWNLLRFDFVNKATTGTPDDDACDYVALYMTKDGAKVSETDYRFDNLVMKAGQHFYVVYYSKYGWQSAAGTYLEDSTADTDLLNADVEEYQLFVKKLVELGERHLRHHSLANDAKQNYSNDLINYQNKYSSEALPLVQTYYNL